jgi:hypothetical protein
MKLPQLSLRELFLLVVIAAMGCGWWVEHWRNSHAFMKEQFNDLAVKQRRLTHFNWWLQAALESRGYRVAEWGETWQLVEVDDEPAVLEP